MSMRIKKIVVVLDKDENVHVFNSIEEFQESDLNKQGVKAWKEVFFRLSQSSPS